MGRIKLSDFYPILRWKDAENTYGDDMYRHNKNMPLTKRSITQMFDCWQLKVDQALKYLEEVYRAEMASHAPDGLCPYKYIERQNEDILTLQDWTRLVLYIKVLESNNWWETSQYYGSLPNFPHGDMPNSQPLTHRNMYQVRKMLSLARSLILEPWIPFLLTTQYADIGTTEVVTNYPYKVPLERLPAIIGWLPVVVSYNYDGYYLEYGSPIDIGYDTYTAYPTATSPISPSTGKAGRPIVGNGAITGPDIIYDEVLFSTVTPYFYSNLLMIPSYYTDGATQYPPYIPWYDPEGLVSNDFSEL